ncbi:MAG: sugar transferase [Pararhodobacter sp.]
MSLHYRALPDLTGVDLGPLPAYGLGDGFTPYQPATLGRILPSRASGYVETGKRVFDILLASVALILSAPVLVLLAALLWLESGNPLYTQERLGRNGRRFRMYKLRTMVPGARDRLEEFLARSPALREEWNRTQKLKDDPRITPLGRILRKTSLDELPQILNVLKGDMSLVGPRPMLPEQLVLYLHPPAYLSLRPGITGLWQVTARNEESFDLRAIMDLRYAQRLSFINDLKIIGATFRAVCRATGY